MRDWFSDFIILSKNFTIERILKPVQKMYSTIRYNQSDILMVRSETVETTQSVSFLI